MATISLRIPEEELNILKDYARIHNASLSSIIRNTMMERIENEYDMKVFAEYETQKENGSLKTRPIDKLWKELDL